MEENSWSMTLQISNRSNSQNFTTVTRLFSKGTGDLYEGAVEELEENAAFAARNQTEMNRKRDALMKTKERVMSLERARK